MGEHAGDTMAQLNGPSCRRRRSSGVRFSADRRGRQHGSGRAATPQLPASLRNSRALRADAPRAHGGSPQRPARPLQTRGGFAVFKTRRGAASWRPPCSGLSPSRRRAAPALLDQARRPAGPPSTEPASWPRCSTCLTATRCRRVEYRRGTHRHRGQEHARKLRLIHLRGAVEHRLGWATLWVALTRLVCVSSTRDSRVAPCG